MKKVLGFGLALSLFTFPVHGSTHAEGKDASNNYRADIKKVMSKNLPKANILSSFSFKNVIKSQSEKSTMKSNSLTTSNADYQYVYESEPNDDFSDANYYDMNYYMVGSFSYDDADSYWLTIPKSGQYVLAGTTDADNLMDLGIGIFDSSGEIIDPLDMQQEGKTKALSYQLSAGDYYIGAIDLNNSGFGEDYLFKLTSLQDTTAPYRPKVNQVDDNDTYVTGTAERNSNIIIQAGDALISTNGYADSNGKFKIRIPRQKAGTYIGVSAMDQAGNQGKFTDQWVIDKTAPSTLTVKTVTTKTVNVTGKTEANASVQVKRGTTSLGTAKADSKGNYKVKISKQRKGNKLTVIARDKAKNAKTIYTTVK
ncbi:hypothetical protein SAMN05443252_11416 [Bacillus sp. OV322]|uniref:Ig-like domain-containing protein n=1 Tax=Bacillus sp. OV322 TaxID=1882764 RepID=UPI0008E7BC79|nr:Ig-like domain-containing protein [Bacillus sp. OV322]SFD02272.1 hypothetical protein SAMN05443252_11416 [Bacillus sp. OV322]